MTRLPLSALPTALFALVAACAQPQPSSSDTAPATPSATAGPATNDPFNPSAIPAGAPASAPADLGCGSDKVQRWIGQKATDDVRDAVARASGAATMRWLYPDSIVTEDFSPERLNVMMDPKSDVIVSARCG